MSEQIFTVFIAGKVATIALDGEVAVLSEMGNGGTMAQRIFFGRDALGQAFTFAALQGRVEAARN